MSYAMTRYPSSTSTRYASSTAGRAPLLGDAPAMKDHLCEPCAEHYAQVKKSLEGLEVPFIEDARLVRGLDYYTHCVRVSRHRSRSGPERSGRGWTLRRPGRIHRGQRAPGVGFALGVDRIVLASTREPGESRRLPGLGVGAGRGVDRGVDPATRRAPGRTGHRGAEGRSPVQVGEPSRRPRRRGAAAGGAEVDVRIDSERAGMPLASVAKWLEGRL